MVVPDEEGGVTDDVGGVTDAVGGVTDVGGVTTVELASPLMSSQTHLGKIEDQN